MNDFLALYQMIIIDDEPSILKAVSMTLKQEHIAVTCADNGALALDILKANTFDLILLDIIMPDQDGFSILKVINSSIKPIAVTISGFIMGKLLT